MQLFDARQAICDYGRRLWQRGMVAANDGNLSVRIGDDRLLATPTGVSKGFMEPADLILCDLDGRVVQGERRPSSELKMHLEVYRLRSDAQAVVHAHPPYATAFALAGVALDQCLLPESVLTLGAIPIASYATPSTEEIPASIRDHVPRCDAVLLANHGAVVWADDLLAAYYRMETLEHAAAITHHARALGGPQPLTAEQVAKLEQVRREMGLSGRCLPCEPGEPGRAAAGCPLPAADSAAAADDERALIERITRAVLAALQRG